MISDKIDLNNISVFDLVMTHDDIIKSKIDAMYKKADNGELYFNRLILSIQKSSVNDENYHKRKEYIIGLLKKKIKRENNWLSKDTGWGNLWKILNLLIGFGLGLLTWYITMKIHGPCK